MPERRKARPAPRAGRGRAAGLVTGRTFVIVNPAAGPTKSRNLLKRVEVAFKLEASDAHIVATAGPGHATELAREAVAAGYDVVCAVGGDGTLAETATALAGTGVPLAVVPRGTANQVAANLGIPADIEGAIHVAATGIPVKFDVGEVEGRMFALAAGAGFDAAVMAQATRPLKERWGFGAYLYAALKVSVVAPRTRYRIVADGEELMIDAMSVVVANVGALYAAFPPARMVISPDPETAWHDGFFDVVVLQPTSVPRFAGLLVRLAVLGFGGEGLLHLRAREVTIEADPIVPFQVDGDFIGHTPFSASVAPGALRVLTPRTPRPPHSRPIP